jgi:hypothetical protein
MPIVLKKLILVRLLLLLLVVVVVRVDHFHSLILD